MTKKMTKLEAMESAVAMLRDMNEAGEVDGVLEVLEAEVARLSKPKKPTKAQIENAEYADLIEAFYVQIADEEIAYTTAELAEASGLGNLSPQKMTAVMRVLESRGVVEKVDKATNDRARVGYKMA